MAIEPVLTLPSMDDDALPFGPGDTTAGSETELQAVVVGSAERVDLPLTIARSKYFANLVKRLQSQDMPRKAHRDLRKFLAENTDGVWDNSWVRFPLAALSRPTRALLEHDLLADKTDPAAGPRGDVQRFLIEQDSGRWSEQLLRVPISYLLKLSLAEAIAALPDLPPRLAATARGLMRRFQNDNISPETLSFYIAAADERQSVGRALAKETSLRFLLTQLLTMYANERFGLKKLGQEAIVYFSPHTPNRQKQLNEIVPDSFYSELTTSPCLSGWDRGEEKHEYMKLCHQVLSRSRLHAMAKVRDAGLVCNNLVVLPNFSSASLANNGIHVSLGSRRLGELLQDPASGFTAREEKSAGDLAIKIVEHFLPLFVGSYSAAPYRVGFADFHAERMLGFLPHELDYTQLRMLWRRWKKKAANSIFGQPLTPTGYECVDRALSFFCRLRGDLVPDFRLIDYLSAPLSTDQSPALDGQLGNVEALKRDLAAQGEYDPRMSFYMLYRQRPFVDLGFSGFEARHYSLCDSLEDDLAHAVDLQNLVTALAFRYVARGEVTHADIPDRPTIESERRQVFFGAAVGIPTFYVRKDTANRFIQRVLAGTQHSRSSRRYAGYVRVYQRDYQLALLKLIRHDAAALVEMLGAEATLADLRQRLLAPATHSAAGKLNRGILDQLNVRSPLAANPAEFNAAAESYYRDGLRRRHMSEAIRLLAEQCDGPPGSEDWRQAAAAVLADRADRRQLEQLIRLVLEVVHRQEGIQPVGRLMVATGASPWVEDRLTA